MCPPHSRISLFHVESSTNTRATNHHFTQRKTHGQPVLSSRTRLHRHRQSKNLLLQLLRLEALRHGHGRRHDLHHLQTDRRQPRRRNDAAPHPRSPLLLAPLRPGRRRQRRQRQSQIPRRNDHEGHPGSPQHGLVQHHHRPHRSPPRPLANHEEIAGQIRNGRIQPPHGSPMFATASS